MRGMSRVECLPGDNIYGKATTAMQVITILAVLYANWKGVMVRELDILFYMTGITTAVSGLHYLVTGRRYWLAP